MFDVTVLGSGASLPTLQRHTTSVAVQREGALYLLDCGEGTQIQWRRAGLRFSKLRAICISHLHGDHINGLIGFLQTLALSGREQDLDIVGPPGISAYLEAARQHLGLRLTYPLEVIESDGGVVIDADDHSIRVAPLDHGIATLGYALAEKDKPGRFDLEAARDLGVPEGPLFGALQRGETIELADGTTVAPAEVLGDRRPGKTLAYCVDTRPCESSVGLAHQADLLIHDSTFAEELTLEARRRGHSTARQAADIAARAGARRLLLIHISARYHDSRALFEEAGAVFPTVEVAHDLMRLEV